jgi:hypothetical protein
VKIIRRQEGFAVQLGKREERLLFEVLKLYPRIPPAHHRLSQSGKLSERQDSQALLDEALAEQRADNQRQLRALLNDPQHLKRSNLGCQISLRPADMEWLLQVLNDIRVGSWLRLGSPEEKVKPAMLTEVNAPDVWAMEMSGYFQMHLLAALEGG